jgi:hypothetical protein
VSWVTNRVAVCYHNPHGYFRRGFTIKILYAFLVLPIEVGCEVKSHATVVTSALWMTARFLFVYSYYLLAYTLSFWVQNIFVRIWEAYSHQEWVPVFHRQRRRAVESRLYAFAAEKRFSLLYCRIAISIKLQNGFTMLRANGHLFWGFWSAAFVPTM